MAEKSRVEMSCNTIISCLMPKKRTILVQNNYIYAMICRRLAYVSIDSINHISATDFSIPDFSKMNFPILEKSRVEEFMVEKSLVEKSRVEMSCKHWLFIYEL